MPIGVVFFGILFFYGVAYMIRGSCNSQGLYSVFAYLKYNVFMRFMIMFYLPLCTYTAMTLRDRKIALLFEHGEWQPTAAVLVGLVLVIFYFWTLYTVGFRRHWYRTSHKFAHKYDAMI